MKVLLKQKEKTFSRVVTDTLLVWFLANFLGSLCLCVWFEGAFGIAFVNAFILSFAFSSPVLLIAIPNFYILYSIRKKKNRIAYALLSVFVLSVLLFLLLYVSFGGAFDATQLAMWMSPYAIAAEIIFFMVTSKFILKNAEQQTESD